MINKSFKINLNSARLWVLQTFLPFIYQVFGVFAYFSSALLSESKRSIKKALTLTVVQLEIKWRVRKTEMAGWKAPLIDFTTISVVSCDSDVVNLCVWPLCSSLGFRNIFLSWFCSLQTNLEPRFHAERCMRRVNRLTVSFGTWRRSELPRKEDSHLHL